MSQATFLSSDTFHYLKTAIKLQEMPCLDGFVQLVDTMGEEKDIVDAARVTAQTTAKLPAEDRGLMRYLMRHRHSTPFEMVELKFRVLVAMDTWRQWIRHRTANVNEYSTRYSPAIDQCQTTKPDEWRLQSVSNRQGSSGDFVTEYPEGYRLDESGPSVILPNEELTFVDGTSLDNDRPYVNLYTENPAETTAGHYLTQREKNFHAAAIELYRERVDKFGVAKEQARKDLPLSTMTMAIWKIDMHNLLHFLSLRMDGHAQLEIRTYANAIGKIVKTLYPVLWEAFEQYRLNAMTMTQLDIEVVQKMIASVAAYIKQQVAENDKTWSYVAPYPIGLFLQSCPDAWSGEKNRERDESLAKLQRLGLVRTE